MSESSNLAAMIRLYREKYYNQDPIISDDQFDQLVDDLRRIDPNHKVLSEVGHPVPDDSPWQKIEHDQFMGSQSKVNTHEEFSSWYKTHSRHNFSFLAIDPKLDGVDLSLRYKDGVLVHAVTRGDGSQGEDILRNAIRMNGVITHLPFDGNITVRGQMMISKSSFEKLNSSGLSYKNPRNACAGICRRLEDSCMSYIDFVTFDCFGGVLDSCEDERSRYQWLKEAGFQVVDREFASSLEEVNKIFDHYANVKRQEIPFEIDGLVIRIGEIEIQDWLGVIGGCPVGQVAWKFTSETAITKVLNIVWQPSKGTDSGRLTPKAILEPVDVLGVTITNATLNNREFYTALGVSIGAKVELARANDVIPQIVKVIEEGTGLENIPSQCPTCSSPLVFSDKNLVCPSSSCKDKKVALVQRWVEITDMIGVGEKVVELMVENDLVQDPSDLYKLSVHDVKNLDRMGDKSAQKIIDSIQSKKSLTLPIFISALGILDVGKSVTQLLIDAGYNKISKLREITFESAVSIKGIGESLANALVEGLQRRASLIDNLLAVGLEIIEPEEGGSMVGKSFCFTGAVESINEKTGKRYTRKELQEIVIRMGGSVKDSVGSGLSYLVQANASSTSAKSKKAQELGTVIISDAEFLTMAH